MPLPLRILFAIFLPPLAVIDKGWDKLAITTVLTFVFWAAGVGSALYFVLDGSGYDRWKVAQGYVDEKVKNSDVKRRTTVSKPIYRPNATYIELADGEVAEVVNTEEMERRQQHEDTERLRRLGSDRSV